MNKKEILIICIIMSILLCVSAVSAADTVKDDTNDTILSVSDTDSVQVTNDLSSYSHSENNVLGGENDGAGSFSDLRDKINSETGTTVTLDKNYTFNESSASDMALAYTGVVVSKTGTFTIMGAPDKNITIDGIGESKLFTFTGDIVLKNINFINGVAYKNSPITSTGSLDIDNAIFLDNGGKEGGAIRANGGLTVTNSIFEGNFAQDGGSIYISANDATSLIENCNFTDSRATVGSGGAIYTSSSSLTLHNINITESNAAVNGGAIVINGENTVLENIYIANCRATNGGAMYDVKAPQKSNNITCINNHAFDDGGAIYLVADSTGNGYSSGLSNSTFKSNVANDIGGALYLEGRNGVIFNVTFESNTATNDGGAIMIKGTYWRVYNSTFKTNKVNNQYGGAIYLENSTDSEIWYSNFTGNTASNDGGAIFLYNSSRTTVAYSNFTSNVAGKGGGAIYWNFNADNGTLTHSTFIRNTADSGDGGGVYWNGAYANITWCTFEYNNAYGSVAADTGYGGGLSISGDHGNASNCIFRYNHADVNAGGCVVKGSENSASVYVTVMDTVFEYNDAGRNAGGLCWNGNSPHGTAINCTFRYNHALGSAGALGWQSSYGKVYNSTFEHNYATGQFGSEHPGHGGAMTFRGSHNIAYNCTFYNNTAAKDGGAAYMRLSKLNVNTNTTFELCKFINNTAENNGGVLAWEEGSSYGYVTNCTFTNNTAERSGGAIAWYGNYAFIVYSNFTNNTATGDVVDAIGGGDAGAILWVGNHGLVNYCNFTNNTAHYRGGTVFLKSSTNTTFNNTVFKFNRAGTNGGAIDWQEGAHDGRLLNSIFINNTAWRSAGAVFWNGINGTIYNCNFTNNTAVGNVTVDDRKAAAITYNILGGNGGAIVWTGAVGNINEIKCEFNHANRLGGAIFLEQNENTTIRYASFTNNTADINGGAIDWYRGAANGRVEYSTFINNTAKRSGGAIYWYGTNGTLYNVTFYFNKALGNASYLNVFGETTNGGDGGAVIWTGHDGNITKSEFVNNTAVKRGGAVFLQNNTNTRFVTALFENNTAGTNGGAIDWYKGASNGLIDTATFKNNIANRSGGAIYWCGDYGDIINSNFTNNMARGIAYSINAYGENTTGGSGGAIIWSGSHGEVINCRFIDNNASRHGGAVYMQGTSDENCTNTTFDLCYFEGNNATINGGALDWHEGAHDGMVNRSNFTNNMARANGGAIFWSGHGGDILHSNFTYNYALGAVSDDNGNQGDGGAIIWSGLNGYVDDCWFKFNNASARGGAVYLQACEHGNNNTTFVKSHFINNTAGTNGGAIDWHEGAENGTVEDSEFINNTAKRSGGAIYWYGHHGTIQSSNFTSNTALGIANATDAFGNVTYGGDGGAVIWIGSYGLVDDCLFKFNNATKRGGAVYLQGTKDENATDTNFTNSHFINNTAGTNGGAVDWNVGAHNGLVSNSEFINNTAKRSGGALYWNGQYGTIKDSNFTSNTALGIANATDAFGNVTYGGDGGAVIWIGSHGTVDNCWFMFNEAKANSTTNATGRGGAVYLQGTSAENCTDTNFTNSHFINNTAGTNGGAIDWNVGAHNGLVNGTEFINNTAVYDGGAIFWNGVNGTIGYTNFTNNTVGDDGGAIFWQGNGGSIDNIIAINNKGISATKADGVNTSSTRGGTICLTGSEISISNSTFSYSSAYMDEGKNTTKVDGGAIFVTGNNVNITDSDFDHCNATNNGGTIYVLGNNTNIYHCTFDNSTAIRGGVIYVEGNEATIVNATAVNSYCAKDGGVLYVVGHNCELYNSTFTHNVAGDDGGAIFWEGNDGLMYNITCEDNRGISDGTSHSKGGTICLRGNDTSIEKSTFSDSFSAYNGGTIFITGNNVNITDSDFRDSQVDVNAVIDYNDDDFPYGGAIFVLGDNANILNCTFDNCSAYHGGVMYVQGHNVSINATFKNSNSTKDGGALYVVGEYCKLFNSTFTSNIAGDDGGAIYWQGNDGTIYNITCDDNKGISNGKSHSKGGTICLTGNNTSLNKSSIKNSFSNYNGGGIFVTGNNVNITETEFKNCKVNITAPADTVEKDYPYGGALYVLGNSSRILDCTFEDGKAIQGGVIYIEGHDVTIDNATISDALATEYGGAIFIQGENATISDSTVKNTNATLSGGAIYVNGFNTTIEDSLFNKTNAFGSTGNGGGAIFIEGNHASVTGSNFTDNTANNNTHALGGAIYIDGVNVVVSDSQFNNSKANLQGGAIYIIGANATIRDSNFTNCDVNSADSQGGAIYVNGLNTTISGADFEKCSAVTSGGAIYVLGSMANISYSEFRSNDAGDYAGAIYVKGSQATIAHSNFTSNILSKSGSKGGAIYVDGQNTNITYCNFTKNDVKSEGGALYVTGTNTTISYSNFTQNHATTDAGAIFVSGTNTTVLYCNLTKNYAQSAGAMYVTNCLNAKLINSSLSENYATSSNGGAIIWKGGYAGNEIIGCNFTKNYATGGGKGAHGGAIFWDKGDGSTTASVIRDSRFIENRVGHHGGAIDWFESNDAVIDNCTFVGNKAVSGDGGAIYAGASGKQGNNFTISNCTFINNSANPASGSGNCGGAIAHQMSNSQIVNSTFINNTAGYGGAIVMKDGKAANTKIENCTFIDSNSTGGNGGGTIYIGSAETGVSIYNCTIINSTANSGNAGAIFWAATNPSITNVTIINSKALSGNGGAIYITGTKTNGAKLSNITINNSTAQLGGAIYLENTKKDILSNITVTLANATNNGGAIFVDSNSANNIFYNVTVSNSTAVNNGGAIYVQGTSNNFTKIILINNSANKGGSVYVYGTNNNLTNITVNISHAVNNTKDSNKMNALGGAVYWGGTNGLITNSIISNATADAYGGAIYWESNAANGKMINVTVQNSSAINGGGVYWQGSNGNIINSTFISNYASKAGAALYWVGSNAVLDNSTFIKNYVDGSGGAIYWASSASTFTNVKLYNNTANGTGGAVYWDVVGGAIVNSTMMYNKAINGSAIYVGKSISDIINTTLLENQAKSYEIYNGATTIIDRVGNTITVFTYFRGGDNLLNAIYNAANDIYFTNVTYLGVNGIRNTKDKGTNVTAVKLSGSQIPTDENEIYQTNLEVCQNISVYAYDGNNELKMNVSDFTDYRGAISFTYSDENFPADNLNIKVFHPEDNYYTYIAFANRTKLSTVIIEVEDIYFQQTEYLNITVKPFNASETASVCPGNVTIYINGELYKANISLTQDGANGKVTVPISGLHVNTYDVYVAYSGNGEYIPEYNATTFNVLKIPSWITIDVDDYYYGGEGKAIIRTIQNASANVTVIINGKEYTVEVNETGYAELLIPLLDADNYTAEAYYLDSVDCYASNATDNFTIHKVNSTINITGEYLSGLDTVKLYITVGPADTVGKLTILFNNKEYTVTLTNSSAELTVYNMLPNSYPVYVEYYGDRNHYGSNNTTIIDATKLKSYIVIDVTNITYGENETITFNLPINVTGNLTITFNGETFNKTIENGKVILENLTLSAGNYSVNATYIGDDYFLGSYNETNFTVSKAASVLEPVVENITYADIEHITANINQTGNVSIIIRSLINPEIIIVQNLTMDIANGRNVTWNVSGLASGAYIAQFIFDGNENCTPCEVNSTFIVGQATPLIIVEVVDQITAGDEVLINVTVYPTDKVTGNVTIYLDGVNIGVYDLTEGFVQIPRTILGEGGHNVVAIYNGDKNFTHRDNSTTFSAIIIKKSYIIVHASNIDVGSPEIISVEVSPGATGIVLIDVNGSKYYINLTAGETQISIPDLANGFYTVNATYLGDGQYIPSFNNTTFAVSKLDMTLNIELVNITYGEVEIINITGFNDATGNVTIKINDTIKVLENVPIVNGVVSVKVSDLAAGNYTVEIIYPGDKKYNGNSTSGNYSINQSSTIPIDIGYGNISYTQTETITVYINATGNVTLKLNGDVIFNQEVLEEGLVTFEIKNLPAENYTAEVIFNGNENYTQINRTFEFEVAKIDPKVTVEVQNITYGGVEHIIIRVNASGNVTVRVAGNETNITLKEDGSAVVHVFILKATREFTVETFDGKADEYVYNLAAGVYPVEVIYNGNNNYNSLEVTEYFEVSQNATPIEIKFHPIAVWDVEYINVTVPVNATGNITLNINGINHTEEIDNGVARFILPDLTVGDNVIWAFYDGDKNYTANKTMIILNVAQRTPTMNVVAQNITVGQNGNITVTLPKNATGHVVIEVEGDDTYYCDVSDGSAVIYPKDLKATSYNVHVTYYGDEYDNYSMVTYDTAFNVSKLNTTVDITAESVTYGDKLNITVNVNSNATGNITIKINDTHEKTLPIMNGTVNWIVEGLAADNYTVYATYNGDAKYNINDTSRNVEVKQSVSVISIDTPEVISAATNATVIVRINNTATGNITITVNGTKYNATIENGVATFTIERLDSGEYDITAEYIGDDNNTEAEPVTLTDGLIVTKVDCYQMNITVNDTTVGKNTTVVVYVPEDARGNVSIYVDGNFAGNATIEEGVAKLNITQAAGRHNVTAAFSDGKYAERFANASYHVFKLETPIQIDADPILVGDKALINVTVPEGVADKVTIEIGGISYEPVSVDGNVARFEVSGLTSGTRTVVATVPESDDYVFNSTTANFTVSKRQSYVNISVEATVVGKDVIINATIPDDAKGYVTVNVGGNNYTINTTDGRGSLVIKNMGNGTYRINATYLGDDKYFESSNNTVEFTIDKVPSNINITVTNDGIISNGSDVDIIIEAPGDATGKVNITIWNGTDNETHIIYVNDGYGKLHLESPAIGIYNVTARYLGDDKYKGSENKTDFEVYLSGKELSILPGDINVGQTKTVSVLIPGEHTGEVTIIITNASGEIIRQNATIDGYIELINASTASLTLDRLLDAGKYDVKAVYIETDGGKIYEHEGYNSFNVFKLSSQITVKEITNVTVGENVTIELELEPNAATGNISVFVNGVEHKINTTSLTLVLPDLGVDEYIVHAIYYGDNNYNESISNTQTFKVSKKLSPISMNVTASNVGDVEQINVTLPENAEGIVLLDIGDNHYYANVTDGLAQFNITGLKAGQYNVTATYLGNGEYFTNATNSTVTISKLPSVISVSVENITVGDKAVINITTSETCGNVTVNVDGENYTVFVSGGHGLLVIPDLGVGNHTVNVTFNENGKYGSNMNHTIFEVYKVNMTEDAINVFDLNNGTVVVVVGDNATGTITISVDGQNYTANVTNGIATIDLDNLTSGEHNITVTYSGDANHSNATRNSTITIPKEGTPLNITVNDIKVGDNEIITVTVPDDAEGDVMIEIDGVQYIKQVDNGKATFEVENLAAGNKTVYVKYLGGDSYRANCTTAQFSVTKHSSTINATITDIDVGENVTITVKAPSDATGQVLIDIDGVGYYVNVTDGVGIAQIPRMPNGIYNVSLTYTGDEKYLPSSSSASFNVSKIDSFVIPIAQNIHVGDNEIIVIHVPVDATGSVTVMVNGSIYNFDLSENSLGSIVGEYDKFTVAVNEGNGTLVISGLPKGEYVVSVKYNGDDKYLPSTNSTVFLVSKNPSDVEIEDQGNGTITIDLPENATGNVTIIIDGEVYAVEEVNGSLNVTLDDLTPGKHDVVVVYSGDESHASKRVETTVDIPKYVSPIEVSVENIKVGNDETVTVSVPKSAKGNVTIEIDGKTYTAAVKDGKVVFKIPNLAAGDKTVSVKFSGDDKYQWNSTTAKFKVSKLFSTVKATSKDITVGKNEVITVTVPSDATGQVLVDINGVGYYADIVNGKAKVIVPELASGKYTATVTYSGDDKYLPSTTTTSFKVSKANAPISASGDEVIDAKEPTVVVHVPKDATGTVTIKIDGKKYTAPVKDGKAVFIIPGLSKGNHEISASYSGDRKYEANDTITDIDVYYGGGHHGGNHHSKSAGIDLTVHETGNPIFILLLIVLAIGSAQLRKFKK